MRIPQNALLVCAVSAGFTAALIGFGSEAVSPDTTTVAVSQCDDQYRWDTAQGPIEWPPQPCGGAFSGGGVVIGGGQGADGGRDAPQSKVGNGR